jgi:hypothetical protein
MPRRLISGIDSGADRRSERQQSPPARADRLGEPQPFSDVALEEPMTLSVARRENTQGPGLREPETKAVGF